MVKNLGRKSVLPVMVCTLITIQAGTYSAQATETNSDFPLPQSSENGRYAEVSVAAEPTATVRSALGETPGPGPDVASRAFIYVDGQGLAANYAQVGWRGDYFEGMVADNVCGGEVEIQWTDANGKHQSRSMGIDNCTTLPQRNYPGHYGSFDLSGETFSPNTDVCGRYHLDFGDSPWVCVTMKP